MEAYKVSFIMHSILMNGKIQFYDSTKMPHFCIHVQQFALKLIKAYEDYLFTKTTII